MIKMNLPPLMGRRDAAYDRAAELMTEVVFSKDTSREERLGVCGQLLALLDSAGQDTKSILAMLSSPDTEARERNILAAIDMFSSALKAIYNFAELEARGFAAAKTHLVKEQSLQNMVPPITAVESEMIARLNDLFVSSHERIQRYRGYAKKNFSAENAERHVRAYRAYFDLYHNNDNNSLRNHESSN
jgi:hypothetical protein